MLEMVDIKFDHARNVFLDFRGQEEGNSDDSVSEEVAIAARYMGSI